MLGAFIARMTCFGSVSGRQRLSSFLPLGERRHWFPSNSLRSMSVRLVRKQEAIGCLLQGERKLLFMGTVLSEFQSRHCRGRFDFHLNRTSEFREAEKADRRGQNESVVLLSACHVIADERMVPQVTIIEILQFSRLI